MIPEFFNLVIRELQELLKSEMLARALDKTPETASRQHFLAVAMIYP